MTALERVRGLLAKPHLSMTEVEEIFGILETDEFDALVRDAMRYRWLRADCNSDHNAWNKIIIGACVEDEMDAAIDQAIDAERGGG